jgi:hypothetical protein
VVRYKVPKVTVSFSVSRLSEVLFIIRSLTGCLFNNNMDSNPVSSIPPSVLADLAREDQGPKTVGLVATFLALAIIAVCLRFVARIRLGIPIGWEDYFILVSMVSIHATARSRRKPWLTTKPQTCSILASACQIMQVHHGFGKHQVFVDLPSTIIALKVRYPLT